MSRAKYIKRLREQALVSQGGCCAYCGRGLSRREATADHVVPRAAGGRTTASNIVAACHSCNLVKSDKPAPRFYSAPVNFGRQRGLGEEGEP